MRWTRMAITAFLAAVLTTQANAEDDGPSFADLLHRAPRDANALVMINAAKIRESAVVRGVGSMEDAVTPGADARLLLDDNVRRVVLTADLDTYSLAPIWEASLVSVRRLPAMSSVASRYNGMVDPIDGMPAVRLPNDGYFIALDDRIGGSMTPADRQRALRWARDATSGEGTTLSPYLARAAEYPETVGTEIIMAVDLRDIIGATEARERLGRSKTLAAKDLDIDALARVIASIDGATLGVRVTDKIVGALRVDFGEEAAPLAPFGKRLILEALKTLGASIDEFEGWNVHTEGKTIYLSGDLDLDGLRRLLSVVDPPLSPAERSADAEALPPTGTRERRVQATREHFDAVQVVLHDVDKRDSIGLSQYGTWFDRYAKKLDQLPILDVDEDVLDYSAEIARRFRGIAMNARGVGIRAASQSQGPSSGAWTSYSPWGYRSESYYRPSPYRQSLREGRASTAQLIERQFAAIDQATANVRRMLVQRYGEEF